MNKENQDKLVELALKLVEFHEKRTKELESKIKDLENQVSRLEMEKALKETTSPNTYPPFNPNQPWEIPTPTFTMPDTVLYGARRDISDEISYTTGDTTEQYVDMIVTSDGANVNYVPKQQLEK